MPKYTHDFVERYTGLVGYGADRETDENTVVCTMQKFSDDKLMETIAKRMSNEELGQLFDLVQHLLKKHLTDREYHELFLK